VYFIQTKEVVQLMKLILNAVNKTKYNIFMISTKTVYKRKRNLALSKVSGKLTAVFFMQFAAKNTSFCNIVVTSNSL